MNLLRIGIFQSNDEVELAVRECKSWLSAATDCDVLPRLDKCIDISRGCGDDWSFGGMS